jgi:hypothetical protein
MRTFVGFINSRNKAFQTAIVSRMVGERVNRLFCEASAPDTWVQRDQRFDTAADRRINRRPFSNGLKSGNADKAVRLGFDGPQPDSLDVQTSAPRKHFADDLLRQEIVVT